MMCSRCNKNVAVVFINRLENGQQINEGLCLACAKELGIKPLEQMMNQLGITEDDIEDLNSEMGGLLSEMNISDSLTMPQNFDSSSSGSSDSKSSSNKKDKKPKKDKKSMLETYGTNLTDRAKEGNLDVVIGREKEIERVIHILNRRTKNNPVLLGEPGVGKTAVAEAVAIHIANETVPHKLIGFEVYMIDFTALLAGTQFRGQFESRLKNLISEVIERKNIILVIDELHNIVSAGDAEGAMNAANILKPALARGEIRVIGATTLNEYRKHIEKDSALERRFAPVIVEEPTEKMSVEILKGLKPFYESYHKVILSDEVLEAAVKLSKRYVTDRFLPDKAIDVIDECGSKKNLENKKLTEIMKLNSKLKEIIEEKEELEQKLQTDNVSDLKRLSDIKMEEFKINDRLQELEKDGICTEITLIDIAKIIETSTGIPITDLTESDAKKLIDIDKRLRKRIIGQDEAVQNVSKVIRRSRAGLVTKKKPASFIFVGPTGVGKTELVKTLSKEIFGSEDAIIRFDMSEYMERHSVSKLIGSPPGYVGYDDAGLLTEKVRRRPYSIILLDEIEKAHDDVFNLLLQVMDDGKLTDSHGKTVHFENTVLIMTSNAGSGYSNAFYGFNQNENKAKENKIDTALKEIFRPEFLNRVDETITFNQLTQDNIKDIVNIMIDDLREDLKDKNITIEISKTAISKLGEDGYDQKFGARPLKRLIQKQIETKLADMYINGELNENDTVAIDVKENQFEFLVGMQVK